MTMTATNDTYRASVAAATTTKIAALATADQVYQAAILAAKAVAGVPEACMSGSVFTTYDAAVRAAAVARAGSYSAAQMAHLNAIENARNAARSAGELPT